MPTNPIPNSAHDGKDSLSAAISSLIRPRWMFLKYTAVGTSSFTTRLLLVSSIRMAFHTLYSSLGSKLLGLSKLRFAISTQLRVLLGDARFIPTPLNPVGAVSVKFSFCAGVFAAGAETCSSLLCSISVFLSFNRLPTSSTFIVVYREGRQEKLTQRV